MATVDLSGRGHFPNLHTVVYLFLHYWVACFIDSQCTFRYTHLLSFLSLSICLSLVQSATALLLCRVDFCL